MKAIILVALVAVTSATFLTSCKPKISGQLVAESVDSSENFRVVNGQKYDSDHSELWNSPLELGGLHPHQNENFRLLTYLAKVETVQGDKIQCGVYEQAHWPPSADGDVENEDLVQEIVLYHYPNAESLVSGQNLGDCKCMRVANYVSGGISLMAFDCGTKSIERVPEIRGAIVKPSGVKIFLVAEKEVDDFLQEKKAESDQQSAQITADIGKLRSELNANQSKYNDARKDASQSYTNDPRYVALTKEDEDNLKTQVTLSNAVEFLRVKYGDPPNFSAWEHALKLRRSLGYSDQILDMMTVTWPRSATSQEQLTAWQAMKEDTERIQAIVQRPFRGEVDNLTMRVSNERLMQMDAAMDAVKTTEQKLDEANQTLKSFQTPYFYLSDFSPTALETSQADAKGNFVIHNPKPGTKIFAKLEPDVDATNSEFFWLVDLPQNGEKVILSENNLFAISTNTP
jgi:hypothetical protein